MAYLALFFALLCFQISTGEGLPQNGKENQVSSEFEGGIEEKKSAELEWTEDDEKWRQNIQNLLGDVSDDSDDSDDNDEAYEFEKLVQQIEELMREHHPEKANYRWLLDMAMWFYHEEDYSDESHDFSDWSREKKVEMAKRSRPLLQKRFSSV